MKDMIQAYMGTTGKGSEQLVMLEIVAKLRRSCDSCCMY